MTPEIWERLRAMVGRLAPAENPPEDLTTRLRIQLDGGNAIIAETTLGNPEPHVLVIDGYWEGTNPETWDRFVVLDGKDDIGLMEVDFETGKATFRGLVTVVEEARKARHSRPTSDRPMSPRRVTTRVRHG